MIISDILDLVIKVISYFDKKKEIKEILADPTHWQKPFSSWTIEHHIKPGQKERYLRSFDDDMKVLWVSDNKRSAEIRGARGIVYITTLGHCTCPDYEERMLPCKHMYLLARHTHLI